MEGVSSLFSGVKETVIYLKMIIIFEVPTHMGLIVNKKSVLLDL
jgi:hypothetical protein